jgi:hypothetical protein
MVLFTGRSAFFHDAHVLCSSIEQQYASAVSSILVHAPCTAEVCTYTCTWACSGCTINGGPSILGREAA